MIKNSFATVFLALLFAFGEDSFTASTLNLKTVFAQTTEDYFCPNGFSYNLTSKLCTSEREAVGPFPPEMINKCRVFGGGPACDGLRWDVDLARNLRGESTCPLGARLDYRIGQCVAGESAYGPFPKVIVEKCRAFGGGSACETMRLSKNFFPSSGSSTITFNFPEPTEVVRDRTFTLWATNYYVHRAQANLNGFPLLDTSGNRLGPKLSRRDWCDAAVEGTVQVTDASSVPKTYNFAGKGSTQQVDCSPFFPSLSPSVVQGTSRVRFKISRGPYGEGTDGLILVPYRTIAVDRTKISIGSVIYIPEARGKSVTLPSGETVTHDGYFYAADVGGAIKGNHIDVFLGVSRQNPFPFVKSRADSTFTAFIIKNTQITEALKVIHQ